MRISRCTLPLALLAALAGPLGAQTPTPAQIQQLKQLAQMPGGADSIKALIAQSGLTPDQIRAKLQAAGYPGSLLDKYLPGGATGGEAPAPGTAELAGLQAIGLPFAQAAQAVPLDTGLVTLPDTMRPPSRVFGVDALRRSTTQFLPTLAGPVPPDYQLGPGDQLVLILTGGVELTYDLPVSREGFILIPQVGQVYVANLTLDQLRSVLYTRLGKAYSGVRRGAHATTQFDVSVASVRTNQVYVTGEVTQPGAYQISALGTVLTALYAAGGVTENADMRQIVVRRLGKVVATMDLYDYLLHGDTRDDVRLETGDVIFVPVHGPRVDVEGAVTRPGIYEVKDGEDLPFVIQAAGGLLPNAELNHITIFRLLPAAARGPGATPRAAISVALAPRHAADSTGDPATDIDAGSSVVIPALGLVAGDSVVVDSLPPLVGTYFVSIAGMVRKPGSYPWREGMTLRNLLDLAGGPTVGADLRKAELARMPANRSQGQLATTMQVQLDSSYLSDRDSAGRYVGPPGPAFPPAGSAKPVPLEPFDQVLIFKQPQFEPQRTAEITGEVRYPGAYALTSKSERLSDLVRRAGGLLATAYPEGAQFIRATDGAGRVNVDVATAIKSPQSDDDVVLQPGDSINVPEYTPTVRVVGAVNAPASILYKPGADLGYYIGNAGGLARNADEGRISVRFADGSAQVSHKVALFSRWYPTPGPGSTVSVPTKPEGIPFNVTQFVSAMAQTLASVVAILVVATKL